MPDHQDVERKLVAWLRHAPKWAQDAYNLDATLNRVMKHSAWAGDDTEAMLWRLCGAMYEAKSCWEATALEQAKNSPIPPLVQKRETINRGEG